MSMSNVTETSFNPNSTLPKILRAVPFEKVFHFFTNSPIFAVWTGRKRRNGRRLRKMVARSLVSDFTKTDTGASRQKRS